MTVTRTEATLQVLNIIDGEALFNERTPNGSRAASGADWSTPAMSGCLPAPSYLKLSRAQAGLAYHARDLT
jgi:hypothetical protein